MKILLKYLSLFLTFILTSCSSSSSYILIGNVQAPIQPYNVRIYGAPPSHYYNIAYIEASSKNSFTFGDQEKLNIAMKRLKEQAAKLGANGIILQNAGSVSTGAIITGNYYNYGNTGYISGNVIPFEEKSISGTAIYTYSANSKNCLVSIQC